MKTRRHPLFFKLQTRHYGHIGTAAVGALHTALKKVLPKRQHQAVEILGGLQKLGDILKKDGRPFEGMSDVTPVVSVLCGGAESLRKFADEIYGEGIRVFVQMTGNSSCYFGHMGVDRSHFVVAMSIEDTPYHEPFLVFAEDPDLFIEELRGRVWAKHMTIALDFSSRSTSKITKKAPAFTREIPPPAKRSILSAKAKQIIQKMQETTGGFEEPRSILMVGPPGVGKSTIILQLLEAMGPRRVVHIHASTWKDIEPYLQDVQMMMPDVIVIDDLDRLEVKGRQALNFFDTFRGSILATANDIRKLPSALIRPPRISEVFEICSEDLDDLAQGLLEGVNPEIRRMLKGLPFADIFEFSQRTATYKGDIARLREEAASLARVWQIRSKVSD